MLFRLFLLLSLLLVPAGGHAQSPTPSAEALRVVQVIGPAHLLRAPARAFALGIAQGIAFANPGREAEIRATMTRTTLGLVEQFDFYGALTPHLAAAFDRSFTADELRQLAEFYATPLGRRLVEQQAPLTEAMQQVAALMFASQPGQAALSAGVNELMRAGMRLPPPPAAAAR
jgi:hypothetical protein